MAKKTPPDFGLIIKRYPRKSALVRRLLLQDPDFRQLCEDYLTVMQMIVDVDSKTSAGSRDSRTEYANLASALELDISRALLQFSHDKTP